LNSRALVAGGTGRVGAAIAERLRAEGFAVVAAGSADADLRGPAGAGQLVEQALAELGGLDLVVHAAGAGFDWTDIGQVYEKLDEEIGELKTAPQDEVEGELGDMLFVIVNLARFLKVDPEQALRKTNAKFRRRFGYVEQGLAAKGRTPQESTIEEMEALWQDAKRHD